MTTSRNPLAVGALALLLAGTLYLTSTHVPRDTDTAEGGFSAAEREALGATPVERGAERLPLTAADPHVDTSDPAAVAAAYVVAGYSLLDTDAGRTNRRAVPYAAAASPPAEVGVLVVSPPPSGHRVEATPVDIALVGADRDDSRRGYLVSFQARLVPAGPAAAEDLRVRYLLLARQPDGRWLVAADTPDAQLGEE